MIRDLLHERPDSEELVDVCIVGAGAAGICLALELERLGKRVVLLEAGGKEVEAAAQEPYGSQVVGHEHRGVHTGRFRSFGGTTQRWGGQILELDAADFEPRSWVQGSGWPFAKEELRRHYARALEMEGVGRSLPEDADVWRALGLQAPVFADLESYFTRWCPEPNFARLHGGALKESSAVSVWLHANAVELLLDGEAVSGVRTRTCAADADPQEYIFRANDYVFCLGAIECTRFFLQPREGGLPWNRSGRLGRHFQDHIDVNVADVVPHNRQRFAELFDNVFLSGYKYHPKLRLSPTLQAGTHNLNCACTVTFTSDLDAVLGRLKTTAKHLLRGRWSELAFDAGADLLRHGPLLARQSWRYARDHRIYNPPDAVIRLRAHCEQEPEGSSSITLSPERDSIGLLRTRLDWCIGTRELRTVRNLANVAALSLRSVADVHVFPELEQDASLRAICDDSNHHMGGMRMATSEIEGVVSPDLRVYGTRNAYVCSGAVFPSSGFSNPTHTVLALAMRLAEHLTHARTTPVASTLNETKEPVTDQWLRSDTAQR